MCTLSNYILPISHQIFHLLLHRHKLLHGMCLLFSIQILTLIGIRKINCFSISCPNSNIYWERWCCFGNLAIGGTSLFDGDYQFTGIVLINWRSILRSESVNNMVRIFSYQSINELYNIDIYSLNK